MADSKITALTSISTSTDPANDPLVIVDVSDTSMAATGTTKKVTLNELLGASGTATLASATITGDLTVRTDKLAVRSTGVGIGTTTLFGDLNIQNGSNCRLEVNSQAGGTTIENLNNARNAYLNMTMYADAYIWNRLGTEAMRLNSTGLGLATSPASALSFPIGTIKAVGMTAGTAHLPGNVSTLKFGINDGGSDFGGVHVFNIHNGTYSSSEIGFFTGEGGVSVPTQRMRIDKVGNVIFSTPSTPPTLATNGQLTVNATSNTNLRFSYRGSDGVTRVANITLA